MKKLMYAMGFIGLLSLLPSCAKSTKFAPASETQSSNRPAPEHATEVVLPENTESGLLAVRLTATGCDQIQSEPQTPELENEQARLSPFSSIKLDIRAIKVYSEENGWSDLKVNAAVYDLITLQNELGEEIAARTSLKEGNISKIAITFGRSNSVMVKGKTFCLRSSANEVIVDLKAKLQAEHYGEMILNIDFCNNIHLEDNYDSGSCYVIKPMITLKQYKTAIM
jgi:hypothetical protein